MTTARMDEFKEMFDLKLRIRAATPRSPIALFRTIIEGQPAIEALFAATVIPIRRIRKGDTDYIGSYYGEGQIFMALRDARLALSL